MLTPIVQLNDSSPGYPTRLRDKQLVERYPVLWTIGGAELLDRPLLGLLCSMRCPGQVILKTYDLARALRDAAVPVIGEKFRGHHTELDLNPSSLIPRRGCR